MSRSSAKGQLGLFLILLVGFGIIFGFLFVQFFITKTFWGVEHTIEVKLAITDEGRKLVGLLSSSNKTTGMLHMETLSSSLALGFDKSKLDAVKSTFKTIDGKYLAVKEKSIFGTTTEKLFTVQAPLPGAGKSGEIRTEVSLG